MCKSRFYMFCYTVTHINEPRESVITAHLKKMFY